MWSRKPIPVRMRERPVPSRDRDRAMSVSRVLRTTEAVRGAVSGLVCSRDEERRAGCSRLESWRLFERVLAGWDLDRLLRTVRAGCTMGLLFLIWGVRAPPRP